MTRDEIIALEDRYGSGLYSKQPLVLVRGEGARLWDADGREYIDCIGGHGVVNVGHANPAVIQAITEQAQRLLSCPSGFYNDQRAELLAELVRIAPPGLETGLSLQLGDRGCGGGAQVCPAEHRPDQDRGRDAWLSRPDLWRAFGDLAQGLSPAL